LGPTGRWPDSEIDYTSKCTAQRANWPAAVHWYRIYVMTAAWHNSLPATSIKGNRTWSGDKPLRAAIDKAMGWWFAHDFGPEACLDSGGTEGCPCDTPGLWNGNWFANVSSWHTSRFLGLMNGLRFYRLSMCQGSLVVFASFLQTNML
jgi:hypothetical protein